MPSYRTGLFLDPKGRGAVTGACHAMPSVDSIVVTMADWNDRPRRRTARYFDDAHPDRPSCLTDNVHHTHPKTTIKTGYDMAVALPGLQNSVEGDEELFKENNKTFDITQVREWRPCVWM